MHDHACVAASACDCHDLGVLEGAIQEALGLGIEVPAIREMRGRIGGSWIGYWYNLDGRRGLAEPEVIGRLGHAVMASDPHVLTVVIGARAKPGSTLTDDESAAPVDDDVAGLEVVTNNYLVGHILGRIEPWEPAGLLESTGICL